MEIKLTWHLLVMIVITVILIIKAFKESDYGLDFSGFFYGVILVVLWLIYGGIVLW